MIIKETSYETDPAERGLMFGHRQREAVGRTIRAYERLFGEMHGYGAGDLDAIGAAVAKRLAVIEPEALSEMGGIAEGAGVCGERLVALNARTEIFAGGGPAECSVIGVGGGRSAEGPLLAQNWDWHPDLADSVVLWHIHDATGGSFVTLTEAGILAKIGLNSRGLAIGINILGSSADGGVDGIPIHVVLRLILDRCRDLNDVQALLAERSYSASTAVTVVCDADEDRQLGAFELWPGGVIELGEEAGVLVHTNHFLGSIGDAADLFADEWPDTRARFDEVRQFGSSSDRLDAVGLKAVLRSHAAGRIAVCCHDPENPFYEARQETLASVVMRPRERSIEVSDGPPCRNEHRRVNLL